MISGCSSRSAGRFSLRDPICFRSLRAVCPRQETQGPACRKQTQGGTKPINKLNTGILLLLSMFAQPLQAQSHLQDARQTAARTDARYNGTKSLRAEFTEVYSGGDSTHRERNLVDQEAGQDALGLLLPTKEDLFDRWQPKSPCSHSSSRPYRQGYIRSRWSMWINPEIESGINSSQLKTAADFNVRSSQAVCKLATVS